MTSRFFWTLIVVLAAPLFADATDAAAPTADQTGTDIAPLILPEPRLSPRLRATAGIRGSRVDTPVEDAESSERDYWRVSFEIEWAMTPRWLLTTGIDRVTEEFVEAQADATSNAVIVGVRYRGLSQQTAPLPAPRRRLGL